MMTSPALCASGILIIFASAALLTQTIKQEQSKHAEEGRTEWDYNKMLENSLKVQSQVFPDVTT